MDPAVGSWYTSYNRLAASGSAGSLPTASSNSNTEPGAQSGPPTSASQIFLQTAHTSATLAGQPTTFNPGGFLTPPPVGYDVFTPLFHPNAKPSQYVNQQRQVSGQVQTPASTKQNVITDPENYNPPHQSFFEHQAAGTTPSATVPSVLAWSHHNNSQLPSPFGILPHESIVSSGSPSGKSNNPGFENTFNDHFPGSQLPSPVASTDFKVSNYSDGNKKMLTLRSQSPLVGIKSGAPTMNANNQTFLQSPTSYSPESQSSNYCTNNNGQTSDVKISTQPSCIVSTTNNTSGKDYTISQQHSRSTSAVTIFPSTVRSSKQSPHTSSFVTPSINKTSPSISQSIQTKAQTKIYPELSNNQNNEPRRNEHLIQESKRSSPVSFSMMDARGLNYISNNNSCTANTSPKLTVNNNVPQQFHVLNQQQQSQTAPYRQYLPGSVNDSEYHHPSRSKSTTSTDSAYSSNNSNQTGPDCNVVVPKRSSPLQAHSQASPLGHVPSPAYPMYNSPIANMSSPSPLQHHTENSATSYKGVVQQQVPPSSPLDVTVPRSVSQAQVAYSSVITRALGATDIKPCYTGDNKTYERHQEDFPPTPKHQTCWEEETRQSNNNRKYAVTLYSSAGINVDVNPQQQVQRVLHIAEKTQSYFDGSNQVTLQDLSGCRGDPMSLVKNLQNLQQNACQVTQTITNEPLHSTEDRRGKNTDTINKKRKFFQEKTQACNPGLNIDNVPGVAPITEYITRIPPPAHHNANPQHQQQQNGYFDYERWNLPPPSSKIFSSAPGGFGSQPTLQHTGNIAQHQSLMVPHHHATAGIPYYPAFHIPPGHHPHHPHEFQPSSSIDIVPINYGENPPHHHVTNHDQQMKDDQPKVVVPNIEEELGFLHHHQQSVGSMGCNRDLGSGKDPSSGFMTSYLKFLQGERDPSPPPAIRGGRKVAWSRSKPYIPVETSKPMEHGINKDNNMMQSHFPKSLMSKETPPIDYANDPRYFPLPKERKTQNFNSSDDGLTSDDDFPFPHKKIEKKTPIYNIEPSVIVKSETKGKKGKKGRPIKPGGPTDRKRKAAAAAAALNALPPAERNNEKYYEDPLLLPPRREISKRKAKEKVSGKLVERHDADGFDNDEEQVDSDSDPAWTPAKLAAEEEDKRKKRGRPPVISKRTKKALGGDGYSSSNVPKKLIRKKHDLSFNHSGQLHCEIDEKLLASVSDEDIDISPFKSGEFVVIKSDLHEEFPALWRIDGKTLLQKYEPFASNGKTLYRNISTYSGWAPQNRPIYQQVPVKFVQQGKTETIVEFSRDKMYIDNDKSINKLMKETEKYQDHFEVYIQTLISQALDSNFLTEIFQEQDDYFLSNVKTVDEITEERKKLLLSTTQWRTNFVMSLSTWPCLNVLKDLSVDQCKGKHCTGCNETRIYSRVLLYGQPYNCTTLEGSPPDPRVNEEKDFLFCRDCQKKVTLYNKVAHQKYLMFLECARRVGDKRIADPDKDTTIILNELLADETWLNQLFKEVRCIWAEIDSLQNIAPVQKLGDETNPVTISAGTESSEKNLMTPNDSQTVSCDVQVSVTVSSSQ